ncbi:alpha/beta hydrolase [Streptomyces sp. NPDC005356]|uniref:alpha/beta hydrolase n=1 Tax=unclassified Streptomyces TaxID=2593676 RepID=UPI0033BCB188
MVAYVLIPGIDGSDEQHWQSLWEKRWGASAVRIAPTSWRQPEANRQQTNFNWA